MLHFIFCNVETICNIINRKKILIYNNAITVYQIIKLMFKKYVRNKVT